jgi:lysine-N-methylase
VTTEFAFPPEAHFTCSRCGDCCRSWNVMLGPGEEERLAALDWSEADPTLVDVTTAVSSTLPGSGKGVRRLARGSDGACVYLGADNLCRIHRHFGADAKPLMCRLYPFGFSRVGSRWAVDASLFCRSIREDRGAPLAERIPEWSLLLAESDPVGEGRHALAAGRPVSGEVLWKIEHHLLELLSSPELTLYDRVRCCLQFARLATSGDPSTAAAEALRQAIAKGLPRQIRAILRGGHMDAGQRVFFYQWLFFALNPLPVGFDRLSGSMARRERGNRLEQARRFSQTSDPPMIDNRELSASFAAIAAVDPGVLAKPSCRPLEAFLKAKILGQRWLIAGNSEMPVTEALPLFLLTYPMAIWTAKALAAEAGSAAVAEGHVQTAVALVDRTLGQIPLTDLPAKAAKALRFVVEETDLPIAAANELLNLPVEEDWEEA